ncbi:MAG: sugar porter family MFS transporter [Planctomycetaceae bacterium]|nr:sugar porter family MFS transporter [Planctomycetaceae bacterium]
MRTPLLVYRSALIAALGGLLFGFDTAVISGTIGSLKKEFFLNDWWLGFTVASTLIGTVLGAATAQFPSNRFGRKPTLLILAALYFVGALGTTVIWNLGTLGTVDWLLFLFSRFLGGIAVGASSVVSPLYTAEISPAKNRGLLVAFTQFNIVFGILLAFFTNYLIVLIHSDSMVGTAYSNFLGAYIASGMEWRWMLGIQVIPAALFFALIFIIPESPRWLIGKGKTEKAKAVLAKLGTDEGRSVDEEVKVIQVAIDEETRNVREAFFTPRLFFPIMLAICMAAFNQLSGINAILYYAPSIFSMAGASNELAMFLPVVIGLTNLIFTMAAMLVIDSFGRKRLMLVGSIGYVVSLGVVASAFLMFAPQFSVSTANFAVQGAQQKVEQSQNALATAPEDTKEFWQSELKEALVDYVLAVDAAIETQSEVAGQNPTPRERESLLDLDIEALQAEIEAKIAEIDLSPTVPMWGILTVLFGLMFFIASHAFGQGACIWVFISEIFPNKVRAQGQALGAFVHWILAAVVSLLFPPLLSLLGPANIFLMFAGFMVLQLVWVLFLMPETKQVPLEEMQKRLGIKP